MNKLLNTDILIHELPKIGTSWFLTHVLCEWLLICLNCWTYSIFFAELFLPIFDMSCFFFRNQSAPHFKLNSCNDTVLNILGLCSDRYLLFSVFRGPFNGTYPSAVKSLVRRTSSALHACSPNQLTNRPLETKISLRTLLNVLLCNLKFFPKRWVRPRFFLHSCLFENYSHVSVDFVLREMNEQKCLTEPFNVAMLAEVQIPNYRYWLYSSPISYTKHRFHFQLDAIYSRSMRKWTFMFV
jgi:hypothetical protein